MSRRTARDGRLVPAAGRFRARRPGRTWARVALAVLAVVGFVSTATWLAYGSDALALRKVTVDGVTRVSVQQVLQHAGLTPGRSLLLVNPADVSRRVERLPAVARAQVTRKWPHTLLIHVVERRPAGVVVGPAGATLLDDNGVAFATQPTPPAGLLLVEVTGPVPGDGSAAARAAMQVVAALPRRLRRQVEQVTARSPDDVALDLRGSRTVEWGSATDNRRKARVLQVLLRRPASTYDVSVPDVVVTG